MAPLVLSTCPPSKSKTWGQRQGGWHGHIWAACPEPRPDAIRIGLGAHCVGSQLICSLLWTACGEHTRQGYGPEPPYQPTPKVLEQQVGPSSAWVLESSESLQRLRDYWIGVITAKVPSTNMPYIYLAPLPSVKPLLGSRGLAWGWKYS